MIPKLVSWTIEDCQVLLHAFEPTPEVGRPVKGALVPMGPVGVSRNALAIVLAAAVKLSQGAAGFQSIENDEAGFGASMELGDRRLRSTAIAGHEVVVLRGVVMIELVVSKEVRWRGGCRRAFDPFVKEAVDAGLMFDDLFGDLGRADAGATITGEKNKIPVKSFVVCVYVRAIFKYCREDGFAGLDDFGSVGRRQPIQCAVAKKVRICRHSRFKAPGAFGIPVVLEAFEGRMVVEVNCRVPPKLK